MMMPNNYEFWYNLAEAQSDSLLSSEAIASYDQAVEINPNYYIAWYYQACCYALQGNLQQAIKSLAQAINLNPEECQEWVKTNSDFDSIRHDCQFSALLQK
jgi:tetratricopeptide (TPR) repeat protein